VIGTEAEEFNLLGFRYFRRFQTTRSRYTPPKIRLGLVGSATGIAGVNVVPEVTANDDAGVFTMLIVLVSALVGTELT
jgi:hypothetical protein